MDQNVNEMEQASEKKPVKIYGVASLVFGILTLLSNFISFNYYSYFPFIALGMTFGDKLKNKKLTPCGKVGFILTIVGYAITAINALKNLIMSILIPIIIAIIAFAFVIIISFTI